MSPRSLRLLEISLLSAFVSFGVSMVVLLGMAPPSTSPPSEQDQLRRLAFERAVVADMRQATEPDLDEDAAAQAKALYQWYVDESERRANMTELEWVKHRIESIEQLQTDLATMRRLEAEAMALEQAQG